MKEASRRALSMADQIVSSASNFVPGFFAAHMLDSSSFARFALIQVGYILAIGLFRTTLYEVALVAGRTDSRRELLLSGLDVTILISLICTPLVLGTIVMVGRAHLLAGVLCIAFAAMVLAQDGLRQVSLYLGGPGASLVNDTAWLMALTGSLMLSDKNPSLLGLVGICALTSIPGALLNGLHLKYRPSAQRALASLRHHNSLRLSFLGDWTIRQATAHFTLYGLASFAGPLAVAGVRGAQLLMGPINIFFAGAQITFQPWVVRLRDHEPSKLRRFIGALTAALSLVAICAGVIASLLPLSLLTEILGSQAEHAQNFIVPFSLYLASSALALPSSMALRALRIEGTLVRLRGITALLVATGGISSFLLFGTAVASLWGIAAANSVGAILWARMFLRLTRAHRYLISV